MHDARCTMHDARCTMHDAQCAMLDYNARHSFLRVSLRDLRSKSWQSVPPGADAFPYYPVGHDLCVVPPKTGTARTPFPTRNTQCAMHNARCTMLDYDARHSFLRVSLRDLRSKSWQSVRCRDRTLPNTARRWGSYSFSHGCAGSLTEGAKARHTGRALRRKQQYAPHRKAQIELARGTTSVSFRKARRFFF